MFSNTQSFAMSFAFPDVSKTPTPVGPVPLPYPNFAFSTTAIPNVMNVFTGFMPTHNLMTTVPLTTGDEPGVAMGVVSNMIKGPSRHVLGSFKVFISVAPQTRMLDPSAQNGIAPNIVGATLTPSQVKTIVLT